MFARLWWKEARQTWPVWAFLAVVGIAVQTLIVGYTRGDGEPRGLAIVAEVVTLIYVFLIAAAVFAGERENATLWILDALPVDRRRLWAAKASFALATAVGLGGVLLISALGFGGYSAYWRDISGVALLAGLVAMGWGLFWSAILANAMTAAVLAMVSLAVTLLVLVDLQTEAGAIVAAPGLLFVAAVTTAASAWFFRRSGPPRWDSRRTRPAVIVEGPASNVLLDTPSSTGRLARVWTYSVPRLLWETLRQVKSELWMLVGLAIASGVGPVFLYWNVWTGGADLSITLFGAAGLALMTGVLALNGENRGGTRRFLLQHGARPGVVWAIKVGTWWLAALGLWTIVSAPVALTMPRNVMENNSPFLQAASIVLWVVSGLTIIFSIGVLCGMAFRRGIMAGMIALVASLAVGLLLGGMAGAQVMFPWHWPYLAVGLLAVGWAWSGDWLYDRPDWGRWARLAAYTAAVLAVLVPCYIAARVREVPQFPPAQQNVIFQRSRIVAPIPEADNAAPLYREADQFFLKHGYAPIANGDGVPLRWDVWDLSEESFDPSSSSRVDDWLSRMEPGLAKLREAARKPSCRYQDLSRATTLDFPNEPMISNLVMILGVSARVRLAKGDMEGAWTEVETLERMARQYQNPSNSWWSNRVLGPVAIGQALRWSVDPRQTAASLEKAAHAWREIPAGESLADRVRTEAALFQNMLDMPVDELVDALLYGRGVVDRGKVKVSAPNVLMLELQTTSWERARARRVYDLLAAAWIERFENNLYPFRVFGGGFPAESRRWRRPAVDQYQDYSINVGGQTWKFTPDDLNRLYVSTPLLNHSSLGRDFNEQPRVETFRRAVWAVLLLRLYQARHDGKLPETLDAITAREGSEELAASTDDLVDVFTGKPLGYLPSHGQPLLPIVAADPFLQGRSSSNDSRRKPAEDLMLLYSVGPDGVDDRAEFNIENRGRGDLVFPIRNDVRPPALEPR